MLEIDQNVLLSIQDNINFIHEIFRQVDEEQAEGERMKIFSFE